jgi:hypothetical protein
MPPGESLFLESVFSSRAHSWKSCKVLANKQCVEMIPFGQALSRFEGMRKRSKVKLRLSEHLVIRAVGKWLGGLW